MICAHIALFVYNRPDHTRKTIEALKQNTLAKDSELIIFSDAAKSEAQVEAVREVRRYIREADKISVPLEVEKPRMCHSQGMLKVNSLRGGS